MSCLATDADYAEWEAEETANCRMDKLECHFEAEKTANHRIDKLKHCFSSLETVTHRIIGQLEAKVKAICQDFNDSRDHMDARIGGIEDYLGLPEGKVQSIILWDGQNVDCIKYMRGVEYQARDEHCLQEHGQEYKIQGQDSASPPAAMSALAPVATLAPAMTW